MAELRIKKEEMPTKAENGLRDRTKRFALQIERRSKKAELRKQGGRWKEEGRIKKIS
jgi:hypothetical protein